MPAIGARHPSTRKAAIRAVKRSARAYSEAMRQVPLEAKTDPRHFEWMRMMDDGKSASKVAELAGVSRGTVCGAVYRLRRALKAT